MQFSTKLFAFAVVFVAFVDAAPAEDFPSETHMTQGEVVPETAALMLSPRRFIAKKMAAQCSSKCKRSYTLECRCCKYFKNDCTGRKYKKKRECMGLSPRRYGEKCKKYAPKGKQAGSKSPGRSQGRKVNCVLSKWDKGKLPSKDECTLYRRHRKCGRGYFKSLWTRTIITKPKNGGRPCRTLKLQGRQRCSKPCPEKGPKKGPQKVNCKVSAWGGWSGCNKKCGGGKKTRTRRIIKPNKYGGRACPRTKSMTRICNTMKCPEKKKKMVGALKKKLVDNLQKELANDLKKLDIKQLKSVRGVIRKFKVQNALNAAKNTAKKRASRKYNRL